MFWWNRRKKERDRAEAERAVRETQQQSARLRAKENRDRSLFARLSQIRRENHIADAVGRMMEGRN